MKVVNTKKLPIWAKILLSPIALLFIPLLIIGFILTFIGGILTFISGFINCLIFKEIEITKEETYG
ncbi:hypothetical protein [Spiroplasma ixodetis]|uniref:hypothetical protein n=1 Tax=Spiroplasma ixodetis TaxID=2141 RepID=UPI0025769CDA|nr:hypothetical protein [Spiroplasma ixodetis]WJG70619.1 hypothetical protein SIXOD_v1c18110 [Spiroplasma ixodetis Y32]